MPRKKKVSEENTIKVRITGPNCRVGDRLYQPGETANVPADVAYEWIQTGRAVEVAAEVAIWRVDEP